VISDTQSCTIEDVEVHHLRTGGVNVELFDGSYETTFVRVRADNGLEGYGEAESLPSAVRAIIEGPSAHSAARALREIVIGRNPSDVAGIYAAMYSGTEFIGRRGVVMHAIGALDMAIWDLRAKIAGSPIWRLLGEQHHGRIHVYASSFPTPSDPGALRDRLEGLRSSGFRHFKLFVEPWWLDDLSAAARLVSTACEVAEDGHVIVDGALAYEGVPAALSLAGVLRDSGAWMFEAPLHLDDVEGHRAMRGCGVLIGVGDLGLTHPAEWEDMLVRGHADVLQPDPSCVGGISGLLQIGLLADRFGCELVPHGYKTRITLAASAHVLAARPGDHLLEYCVSDSPLVQGLTLEQFPVGDDGTIAVPNTPGLGVTVDPEVVARYAYLGPAGSARP
jgi:L-rhamnonate dehydratase